MNLPTGTIGLIIIVIVIALAVAAIIMPIVVIIIDSRLARAVKALEASSHNLAAMASMMRNGKK